MEQVLDGQEMTVAKQFVRLFGVTGLFNHTRKRVFVVPFALLSIVKTITLNQENQALSVSLRRRPWGWQDAA